MSDRDWQDRDWIDTRDALFRNARRTGEYLDEFTYAPSLDPHITNSLSRLPKCLMRKNGKIVLKDKKDESTKRDD